MGIWGPGGSRCGVSPNSPKKNPIKSPKNPPNSHKNPQIPLAPPRQARLSLESAREASEQARKVLESRLGELREQHEELSREFQGLESQLKESERRGENWEGAQARLREKVAKLEVLGLSRKSHRSLGIHLPWSHPNGSNPNPSGSAHPNGHSPDFPLKSPGSAHPNGSSPKRSQTPQAERRHLEGSLGESQEREQDLRLSQRSLESRLEEAERGRARLERELRDLGAALREEQLQREQLRRSKAELEEQKRLLDRSTEKLNKEVWEEIPGAFPVGFWGFFRELQGFPIQKSPFCGISSARTPGIGISEIPLLGLGRNPGFWGWIWARMGISKIPLWIRGWIQNSGQSHLGFILPPNPGKLHRTPGSPSLISQTPIPFFGIIQAAPSIP